MHRRRALRLVAVITVATLAALGLASPAQAEGSGSITGRFLDSTGAPLPDTKVTLLHPYGQGVPIDTTVDASGAFRLDAVPEGFYNVSFEPPGGPTQWAYQKTYQSAGDFITVTAGANTVVNDTQLPHGSIGGIVTDAAGTPVSGVEVRAVQQNGMASAQTTTDNAGRYRLAVFPASYKMWFRLPDSDLSQFSHKQLSMEDAQVVSVAADQDVVLDEQLLPIGSLSGRFTDTSGAPVESEFVSVQLPNGTEVGLYASTDANGRFRFPKVFAGDYIVRFHTSDQWAYGKLFWTQADIITIRGDQETTVVDSVLGTGSLTVFATDAATGDDIANFCATAGNEYGCSNGSGRVLFEGVRQGSYDLAVVTQYGNSYLPNTNATATVTAGQNTTTTVPLQPAGAISVTVKDRATGAPVGNTCVEAMHTGTPIPVDSARWCGDGQGNVRIGLLTGGDYNLFAIPGDGSYGSQWIGTTGGTGDQREAATVTVSPGSVATGPTVYLDRAGSVTGTVSAASPVSGGTVSLLSYDFRWGAALGRYARIDDEGRYTMTGLGPYKWPLLFQGPPRSGLAAEWSGNTGNRFEAKPVNITSGETATANATLTPGVTLAGTVTVSGKPPTLGGDLTAYNKATGDILGVVDLDRAGRYSMPLFASQRIQVSYSLVLRGANLYGWYDNATDRQGATPINLPASGTTTLNINLTSP